MATSGPEEKRRKSKSGERREHRKRKRDEDSGLDGSKSRRRRKSSRSERAGGAAAKKKVRTISELVKLVISGEVKVPKSLRHYMEDRPQLLDQTFTILSESDVRGMLPDILQGLTLRHVRQLCLDQLQSMSQEDVMDCVEPQTTSSSLNLDAAVFELLGGSGQTGEENGPQERVSEGGDDLVPVGAAAISGEREGATDGEKEEEMSPSLITPERDDDVSGERSKEELVMSAAREDSPPQTMECDTTTDISEERLSSRGPAAEGDGGDSRSVSSEDTSSENDLDDCWLCDFPDEVSEWARLREIEFRQRALEAELKRGKEGGEGGLEREGERGGDREGAKVNKSKAIEVQMRQRALQSLLAKKKETK